MGHAEKFSKMDDYFYAPFPIRIELGYIQKQTPLPFSHPVGIDVYYDQILTKLSADFTMRIFDGQLPVITYSSGTFFFLIFWDKNISRFLFLRILDPNIPTYDGHMPVDNSN